MPTLHWIGKDKVAKHHHEVPFKTLRREYVHTAPEETPGNSTGNRIIHGDKLEALKALLPEFEGRVGEKGTDLFYYLHSWLVQRPLHAQNSSRRHSQRPPPCHPARPQSPFGFC